MTYIIITPQGMTNDQLTHVDMTHIIDALEAAAPSGGGSPTYTLRRRLTALTGIEPNQDRVARIHRRIADERIADGRR